MLLFTAMMLAQAAAPAAATTQAKAPEDKVVCRLIPEGANTRIPSRICRTESEWEQIAKDAQESMNSSRNDRTTGGPNN